MGLSNIDDSNAPSIYTFAQNFCMYWSVLFKNTKCQNERCFTCQNSVLNNENPTSSERTDRTNSVSVASREIIREYLLDRISPNGW